MDRDPGLGGSGPRSGRDRRSGARPRHHPALGFVLAPNPCRARPRDRGADRHLANGAAARPLRPAREAPRPTTSRRRDRSSTRCWRRCCCALPMRMPWHGSRVCKAIPATPLGEAHVALARAAASASAEAVKREYFDLFLGVGRGEVVPYASYYLTGFLNERPLARLRQDMKHLGLERSEGHCDPEDHLGTLCEIMSGFAAGRFEAPPGTQDGFFARHLAPVGRTLLRRPGEGGVREVLPSRSGRSAGCSSTSRRKASRWRRARAHDGHRQRRGPVGPAQQGGRQMQEKRPTGDEPPQLLRRVRRRVDRRGARPSRCSARARRRPTIPARRRCGPRYQETDHVKAFYRVNSYPAAKG